MSKITDWYLLVVSRSRRANRAKRLQALFILRKGEPDLYERELNLTWPNRLVKANEIKFWDFMLKAFLLNNEVAKRKPKSAHWGIN